MGRITSVIRLYPDAERLRVRRLASSPTAAKWPTGVPEGRPTAAEPAPRCVWAIRRLQAQGKPFGAKTIAAMIGVHRTTATALIFDGMKRLKRRGEAVTIEALAGEFGLPVNVVQQQIGP